MTTPKARLAGIPLAPAQRALTSSAFLTSIDLSLFALAAKD